ncbi:hypothetical protein [Pseudoprevotella muciniphila]|uniref:hypothetical protein n=1 Tax=Pseudoprevotella muciniphila TaxID=2133944 RepID=UPI0011BCFFB4|nr:hypothetical protein [Pseudoprevotella muciniphila]
MKEAKQLTDDEMKHVFGGSSVTGSGCFLTCDNGNIISELISGCDSCTPKDEYFTCQSSKDGKEFDVTCSGIVKR